jgi:hypothetical protein
MSKRINAKGIALSVVKAPGKVKMKIRVGPTESGDGTVIDAMKIVAPDLDSALARAAKNWEKKGF